MFFNTARPKTENRVGNQKNMKKVKWLTSYQPHTPRLAPSPFSLVAGLLLLFTSCAVSLSPKFDQNIIDELSASSTEAFQLMAAVTEGTSASDFSKREDEYNSVIGSLEALQLQMEARPMPKNKILEKTLGKVNQRLQQRGMQTVPATDTAPSATAVKHIIENMVKMKATDKRQGVTATELKAFKGNVQLYLDQAVTYESYLNQ